MADLVLKGAEQKELEEALDRSWIGEWGLLPPKGCSVPISTSHSRCKHLSLKLGFSFPLEHPEQQAAGVQHPPNLAWGHGEKQDIAEQSGV